MNGEVERKVEQVRKEFYDGLAQIGNLPELSQFAAGFTGKKGRLQALFVLMKEAAPEVRPLVGACINALKEEIEGVLRQHRDSGDRLRLEGPRVPSDLPSRPVLCGHYHPLNLVRERVETIFSDMGYARAEGPEVEDEYHVFDALNIPPHHPTRDEHDSFFIEGMEKTLLRTQTSPVQIRYMESHQPPIKVIAPGRTFRKDEPDATHTPCFHQVEGLVVDVGIHMGHLRGTLDLFCTRMFGAGVKTRFRPSYFPFTEPSAEVDVSCFRCLGRSGHCPVCKGTGWLEILGCGMVHPTVLGAGGIDAERYTGFAFGMGIERLAMLWYGVDDIRHFYENDLRFLQQFHP